MAVAGCVAKDTGRPLDDLLNDISAAHGVDPVEMLGGAVIAEGGWNEHAIRERKWADVSYGYSQPSVAWCSKPDGLTPSTDPRYRNADTPENRAACKDYFWDAERALAYCTPLYAKLRAKEDSGLDAWCRWNKPSIPPAENPNRDHYERSLAEAEQYRVVEEPPVADISLPARGPDPVFASLEDAAAYCGAEAYRKQLIETACWAIAVRDEPLFRQCYETLNPGLYVPHFDEIRLGK